jgi:hypothetical protein
MLKKAITSVCMYSALSFEADGAQIRLVPIDDHMMIFIDGPIVKGDFANFSAVLPKVSFPFVLLRSPGGDLEEAIKIGKLLWRYGAAGVAPDFVCASACATIWVSGWQRYLAPSSLVGFHAAYTIDDLGNEEVSGWANAPLLEPISPIWASMMMP